jgi:hypothetical protein
VVTAANVVVTNGQDTASTIRQRGISSMNKGKMNLQQFADRHALQIKGVSIQGPYGELYRTASGQWLYFQRGPGYRKFNPVTQAKLAIEATGIRYTAPAEPIKEDRRAFLIVKRTDGWYVAEKAGPFKTRKAAGTAREKLKSHQ